MNLIPPMPRLSQIVYPESDGKPMADNTRQFRWIQTLHGNLDALFRNEEEVVVIGNCFWYPAEGFPEVVAAPDVMVVFGRPKGDRRSYKQWEEGDIGPQVAFEVLSHHNDYQEMRLKLDWYEDHGVEEYYVYDPEGDTLEIWIREGSVFRSRRPAHDFVSPLLKIRFDLSGDEMAIFYPDGRRFLTFTELELARADAQRQADDARRRADRLAELSLKLLSGQASDEEKQELARLATPPAP
jgi:Uma2 family endonuclease